VQRMSISGRCRLKRRGLRPQLTAARQLVAGALIFSRFPGAFFRRAIPRVELAGLFLSAG
jgi:hypothetical protein